MNVRSITVAFVTLLIATTAMAQQRVGQYLQLTPDQIASWKQIRADEAAALKPLVANARELRTQLADAIKANDQAAAGKLTLEIAAVREQIRASREASKAKLEAVLTPDQKTKFEAFQAAVEFLKKHR